MSRRRFLALGGASLLTPAVHLGCGADPVAWRSCRLLHAGDATPVERAAIRDAGALLSRAIGAEVPVLAIEAAGSWTQGDVVVATPAAGAVVPETWRPASALPGSYRLLAPAGGGPGVVVAGADAGGARNGLYRLLEDAGLGLCRDGDRVPSLAAEPMPAPGLDLEAEPRFRRRGEMIWDNYLGPSRYCAAAWGLPDWERALVHMARMGLDFLEFYPPLASVWARAFPRAEGLEEGPVWKAEEKHALARAVLARARALGIQVMYVLTYGWFPEPVRRLYPDLEWAGGGFLCAHQPELREMTRRAWRVMLDELGTDHLYAVRHRGEEGQSYSDPCRSITKAQGMTQAHAVLHELDPEATITVWTWAEDAPVLFGDLPDDIVAAHIRHGLGGMFEDVGAGREQSDGRPDVAAGRRWMSGQFTVFSGSETTLRTAWSDPAALASDARAAAADPTCDGLFQWPEWTATSPWLSDSIARLAWSPGDFRRDDALVAYAARRHGEHAGLFLRGFRPLVEAGNARLMVTPRKRVVVPYFLAADEIALLDGVRDGVRAMRDGWPAPSTRLLERDLVDLVTWVGVRQAHVFEAAALAAARAGDAAVVSESTGAALDAWDATRVLLAEVPELSVVAVARRMAATAPVSRRAVDAFWVQACDFYRGYPLVLSPEAIELVFAEQSRRLAEVLSAAAEAGTEPELPEPGFFWHDFPDPAWAEVVVGIPREDAEAFEREMRRRLEQAIAEGSAARAGASLRAATRDLDPVGPLAPPSEPSVVPADVIAGAVARLLDATLPMPRGL